MIPKHGLIFNVASLLTGRVGCTRQYRILIDGSFDDDLRLHALSGDINLMRTDASVLVECKASAACTLECARCLVEMSADVEATFQEEFWPVNRHFTRSRCVQYLKEKDSFEIDKRNYVDIREPLRQAFYSSVPFSSVCSSDCRGLCVYCRNNLNENECSCLSSELYEVVLTS